MQMHIVTTETVPGKKTVKSMGIVRGNSVRAKHLGKDILAGLRNIVGGELNEYSELLNDARSEAIKRMEKEAREKGANAVVNVRFTTAQIATAAAEILVYGTAVVIK